MNIKYCPTMKTLAVVINEARKYVSCKGCYISERGVCFKFEDLEDAEEVKK